MTRLKRYLQDNGIKQKWLAEQSGMEKEIVNRICRGDRRMLAEELLNFSVILNCDPAEIAGEVEEVADVS